MTNSANTQLVVSNKGNIYDTETPLENQDAPLCEGK